MNSLWYLVRMGVQIKVDLSAQLNIEYLMVAEAMKAASIKSDSVKD